MIKKIISVVAAVTFNSIMGLSYAATDSKENEAVAETEENETDNEAEDDEVALEIPVDSTIAQKDTSDCDEIKDVACLHVPEAMEVSLDSLINAYRKNYLQSDCITDSLGEVLEDSVYIERLKAIPSIMEMNYNSIVKRYIELYTVKKRKQVEYMLGLGKYYFPIFEDVLDSEQMPIELKYLPVIESALNPRAFSRAGASGLWQFMFSTGKMYGLDGNSLVDERRDPFKATHAAAKYLKNLYGIYKDWSLVIAAYNCGPGNVNKAIRRSGGKRDYWAIYPFLPRETRGYVPAFIAATYTMTYYAEHKICPANIQFPLACDTVHTTKRMSLQQIAAILGQDVDVLRNLNPQYRRDIIPGSKDYTVCLPSSAVNGFIEHEDTICNYKKEELCPQRIQVEPASYGRGYYGPSNGRVYRVRQGDTLGSIARRNRVSVAQIKRWNNLRSDRLSIGQKLIVR